MRMNQNNCRLGKHEVEPFNDILTFLVPNPFQYPLFLDQGLASQTGSFGLVILHNIQKIYISYPSIICEIKYNG